MIGSRIALSIASVLTLLLLQASVVGPLVFPVPASLPVVVVAIVGIYAGPGGAMPLGFALGLLADLGSDHPAGVLALAWMTAGLLGGRFGGLVTQRARGVRPVAVMAGMIGTAVTVGATCLLALVGTHADSLWLAVRDLVPLALIEPVLALLAVHMVRALLRWQGVRSPRTGVSVIGRASASA